jgi:hypothetical protein
MQKTAVIAIASVLFASFVPSLPVLAVDLDAFGKQPGVEVIKRMVDDKEVTEYRKGGVVFYKWPDHVISIDQSGLGAVLCIWKLYVDALLAARACFPDSRNEVKEDLAHAVDAMNDFIVANNPDPVTKSGLETYIAKRDAEKFSPMPSRLVGTPQCPDGTLLAGIEKESREQRRAGIVKLLSVPRPPVMNPCL